MKQVITENQFNELSDLQKSDWYQFMRKNKYTTYDHGGNDFQVVDFPSIGKMIEFLDEKGELFLPSHFGKRLVWRNDMELCDYLWQAVKEVLGKEENGKSS